MSGVRKKGRPPGHSAETERRARFVRMRREAGWPDEAILGGIAPYLLQSADLPQRERQQQIRRMLNRWERPAGRTRIDAKSRQALGYARREVGDEWLAITREPGWSSEGNESAGEMERTARQLERQARAVQAAELARSFAVPRPRDVEGYVRLVESKAATLRERAEQLRAAERAAREQPVKNLRMDDLTPADRKRLRMP
jgi:hypothetical protein